MARDPFGGPGAAGHRHRARGRDTERAAAAGLAGATRGHADDWASHWSKELNCTVSFLNEGDTFMVVEVSCEQIKVINQEGKSGWINFPADQGWTRGAITEVFNAY